METEELLAIIGSGEDSRHQFKQNITRAESLVPELAAFSNSKGGLLLIGVTDEGGIQGLTTEDMGRINQLVSNAAKDVKPPISVTTENIALPSGMVMVVDVPEGISKPYMDGNLHVWVKNSANKSKVSAREELLRMFQSSALVHADEVSVKGSSVADIDQEFFDAFFEREYSERVEDQDISRVQLLENMNLAKDGQLNICGTLLFASRPQIRLPVFIVKAVAFPGIDIEDEYYIDSQDINGKLSDVFQKVLGFVLANIRHVQNEQGINSVGEPEIPRIVFEELIANALIHRDYFVSAPVKVLVFADRIEIVSPGHLPNNLTIENIKMGNSNVRNPILASFAPKVLPYRGLGSGIKRAIRAYPDIEFIDDRAGNAFKAIIKRAQ
ncbi:RNA-binding domain-containing protein [Yersinia ruckeri]|uniref:Divergent AAA domain n=1 Tax=Yersinia ruckeri TaxID=29486 RepID=A0A0A8VBS0_YERRU|nr:RNA-binding domain-containing protein [Yersinia ruckeri]EKN3348155.1 putative DNA binding domain-containing protein [Yersinia ruckeri]EKN4209663.1 putative DNA binding domain-containing protein [Yersinia ruckeri]KGA44865.1 divergent AAA domain protein [Yersinia ruckeri ATCC 29473]MCK8596572.1 putative DNA binding domain-containing protein [Yersinia ruckeri]MCK8599916.1 putative DNA binding domain-containing protein [Yersinia ruckeri]